MKSSSLRKTAVAAAVAGTFAAAGVPLAEANVVNLSWRGAFTFLNPYGDPASNSNSDYFSGYYANGDGSGGPSGTSGGIGAPYFPGNVGPNADCTTHAPACVTSHGWYGNRTPVSGTLSYVTSREWFFTAAIRSCLGIPCLGSTTH